MIAFLLKTKNHRRSRCVRLKRSVYKITLVDINNQGNFNMSNGRIYQLSHCTYICKYHLVFTTKYRGKVLADKYIKQELKRTIKMVCKWKGFPIHAWHVGDEHIHMYITVPPKYSISYAVSVIKGKTSAWIKKKTTKFPKGPLWSVGYFISTAGLNEVAVRRYVQNQSHHQIELIQSKIPFWKKL